MFCVCVCVVSFFCMVCFLRNWDVQVMFKIGCDVRCSNMSCGFLLRWSAPETGDLFDLFPGDEQIQAKRT